MGVVFFATVFTHAVDLERVSRGQIMVFASDFLLKLADLLREELDGTATIGTNHMVMAAPVVLMFVPRNSVVKGHLAGQPAFGEKL
jgi:hypothetical protein